MGCGSSKSTSTQDQSGKRKVNPQVSSNKANELSSPKKEVKTAVNTFKPGTDLPDDIPRNINESKPLVKGFSKAKWPLRCHAALDYNINAGHGGAAAVLLISGEYGGPGANSTGELIFVRSGFDANHFQHHVTKKINGGGHFGAESFCLTNEKGDLITNNLFGANQVGLFSNDARFTNLGFGVIRKDGDADSPTDLGVAVNQANGACTTLVLCSQAQAGGAIYMLQSGHKDDHLKSGLICGEDKWKFDVGENGSIQVTGEAESCYGIFHNRENEEDFTENQAGSFLTQAVNGSEDTQLITMPDSTTHCQLVVICSNSSGKEAATSAALYGVSLDGSAEPKTHLIQGSSGVEGCDGNLWSFSIHGSSLMAKGPAGPCRYAVISNFPETVTDLKEKCLQSCCLATGEEEVMRSAVSITISEVTGWVSKKSQILITLDEDEVAQIRADDLVEVDGKWAFQRRWEAEEMDVGLKLVRIYAVRSHVKVDQAEQHIELSGSPCQLTIQPKGVVYALNCVGPSYQAINDVVYASEFSRFANFSYDYVYGTRSRALGKGQPITTFPELLAGGHDGFMFGTVRFSGTEAKDENHIVYDVPEIPSGNYTVRLHCHAKSKIVSISGSSLSDKFASEFKKKKEVLPGLTMHTLDLPVKVDTFKLDIDDGCLSGFAVLDKTYKEKEMSAVEKEEEKAEKQMLIDTVEPLSRSMSKKVLSIVGWSQNLLQNASGEAGDMSHWNLRGQWKVIDGGYGTEKAFVTSHMECTKYQEVLLTDYFPAEYLDTAPDIQVSEWYREGTVGGGHYCLTTCLMDDDGNEIASFTTGMTDRIYRDYKWTEAATTFTNYGPGVRRVGITSMGKDDKYWAGFYGAIISAAVIRVQREAIAAENDAYEEASQVKKLSEAGKDGTIEIFQQREKLINKVVADKQDLLADLMEDNVVPEVDKSFQKQTEVATFKPQVERKKKKKREIRFFVSSTFRDFKMEREELIKKIFREINRVCADRGVQFTYVDLRWGITEQQSETGETIAICLNEIDKCRPYFMCMLGERFGWSQKEEKPDAALDKSFDYAIEKYPANMAWIKDFRFDTSVTQLEVLHGVLRDVDKNKHRSFFYMREPVEEGSEYEGDQKIYQPESDWHAEKVHALRKRVAETKELNVKKYRSVQEICDFVKQDFLNVIDMDFPKGTELSPLDREREAHEAFAEVRRRVYIGGKDYFDAIDAFMAKDENVPFVLLGESGSGKSALVANWVGKLIERETEAFIFVHFIGSSAESASYIKLLRRLFEEMKRFYGFDLPVPSSDNNLISELPQWLRMAGKRAKCFIILDALNQLDDGSGEQGSEHDLQWLPKELPPGVKMLLSTLPGRALQAVQNAGLPSLHVKPLQKEEKGEIIVGYLTNFYGKTLKQELTQLIIDAEPTNNALYLRSLLDEVRLFGSFEQLGNKVREYLTAGTPGDLFAKILARLEGDFEDESRPGLVKDTTAAIWCSHKGMSEGELRDLLDVPPAVWSPFYLSLEDNLVNRNGILNFFHDHLRQAVESKYLPTEEEKLKGYKTLAEFFEKRELDGRKVEELPFLQSKAGELEKLQATISDLNIFKRLVESEDGKFDLIKYWTKVGGFSKAEEAYTAALDNYPADQRDTVEYHALQVNLADFYMDTGLLSAARVMLEKVLAKAEEKYIHSHGTVVYNFKCHSWRHKSNHPDVIDLLQKLGTVCHKQSVLREAELYFNDAIARQNRIITPSQKLKLTEGLLGLAAVKVSKDEAIQAKRILIRARELATEVLGSRHHYVSAIINKIGQLTYKQGRLEESLGYFLQDLKLTRGEVGTAHPRVAGILNDIALVYDDGNDPLAEELYEAALAVLVETYGPEHLDVAIVRYNLGAVYFATNHFAKAKYQFEHCAATFKAFLGEDHVQTKDALSALNDVKGLVK